MLRSALIVLRVLALSIIWIIAFMLLGGVLLPATPSLEPSGERASAALVGLFAQAVVNTAVLVYIILRSRWSGWKLSGAVFMIHFGAMTLLSQMETVAFPAVLNRLPPGLFPAMVLMQLLMTLGFAPLAVLVMGKWRHDPADDTINERLEMPGGEWLWKLALIVVAYEALYFGFGYFVAWRNPAVQEYYGGTDPGSFLAQLANVMRDTPWLPFFQVLRALLWTAIALPVIRSFKGSALETGVAVGLGFAFLMNSAHFIPNAIMPDAVRTAHFFETATSNFIFGLIGGALLATPFAPRLLSGRQLRLSVKP